MCCIMIVSRTVAMALVPGCYFCVGNTGWHNREAHVLGASRTSSNLEWVGYQLEAGMTAGACCEVQSDRWSDLGVWEPDSAVRHGKLKGPIKRE